MAIKITAEEYQKKFGVAPDFSNAKLQSKSSSFGQSISNAFKSGVSKIKTGIEEARPMSGNGAGGLVTGVGKILGGTAETITSPLAPALEPVGKALEYGVEKTGITDNPSVQKFANSPAGEKTIKATETISDYNNALGLVAGGRATINSAKSVASKANKITNSVIDTSEKVASKTGKKIADFVSSEPDTKTSTILKETQRSNFDKFIQTAEQASIDPRKPTPYEIVGDRMAEATKKLKSIADEAGKKKSEYLHPLRGGLDPFDSKNLIVNLTKLHNRVGGSERPIIRSIVEKARSVKTKGAADRLIDEIQDELYNSNAQKVIAEGSSLDKQLKMILRDFNKELKASLPEDYSALNTRFSNITSVVRTLNRALGETVEGVPVRGASLVKQFFSPSGSKAKKIFEYIKKNTGIDLAQDATLAKYAMEVFDDPRARALLEGIPTSPSGLISKGIDILVDKTGTGKKMQEGLRSADIRKARSQTKN